MTIHSVSCSLHFMSPPLTTLRPNYLRKKQLEELRPILLALFDRHPKLNFGEHILDICVYYDGSAAYCTKDQELLEKIYTICVKELGRYILFHRRPALRFRCEKNALSVICDPLDLPFQDVLEAVRKFCCAVQKFGFDTQPYLSKNKNVFLAAK